jgi:hypothetical protein
MLDIHVYWNILTMHGPINVKSSINISKWQMGFNSAFKGLMAPEDEGLWLYSTNIEREIQSLPLVVSQNFPLYEDCCYWLLTFCLLYTWKESEALLLSQHGEGRTMYIHTLSDSVEGLRTFYNCIKQGIVIVYGLQNRGNVFRFRGKIIFSMPKRPDRYWGPPSLLPNRHRGFFRALKRLKSEVYHSPPSSAEV